jgi:hypothetical protein
VKIGIVARSDNTGLGYQTKELTNMLKPDKVMLIDFSPHNNNTQHPEWYDGYNVTNILGYPTGRDIEKFLNDLDMNCLAILQKRKCHCQMFSYLQVLGNYSLL